MRFKRSDQGLEGFCGGRSHKTDR